MRPIDFEQEDKLVWLDQRMVSIFAPEQHVCYEIVDKLDNILNEGEINAEEGGLVVEEAIDSFT